MFKQSKVYIIKLSFPVRFRKHSHHAWTNVFVFIHFSLMPTHQMISPFIS